MEPAKLWPLGGLIDFNILPVGLEDVLEVQRISFDDTSEGRKRAVVRFAVSPIYYANTGRTHKVRVKLEVFAQDNSPMGQAMAIFETPARRCRVGESADVANWSYRVEMELPGPGAWFSFSCAPADATEPTSHEIQKSQAGNIG